MYFQIVPVPGGFKARIRASNHQVVFVSETVYKSKLSAEAACALVVNGAAKATIEAPA
jgi:uncharacterized protein YegP (UPF0339 family)